jgi:hypothetical protein
MGWVYVLRIAPAAVEFLGSGALAVTLLNEKAWRVILIRGQLINCTFMPSPGTPGEVNWGIGKVSPKKPRMTRRSAWLFLSLLRLVGAHIRVEVGAVAACGDGA